ncbi:hypothetical protein C8J56DRAFT_533403 [Mycena floridula]|nr:hypothetical protein C8J56DRAFT_533403 [Mycena floridula]
MLGYPAITMTRSFEHGTPSVFVSLMLELDTVDVLMEAVVHATTTRRVSGHIRICLTLIQAIHVAEPNSVDMVALQSVQQKVLSHNAISIICRFLAACSSTAAMAGMSVESQAMTLDISIRFLFSLLNSRGEENITEAVTVGLLQTIPKIVAWFAAYPAGSRNREVMASLITILGLILRSIDEHLVHPGVLRELRKWHHSVDRNNLPKSLPWSELYQNVSIRLDDKSAFKQSTQTHHCANSTCPLQKVKFISLKRCASCLYTFYCDKSCQQQDWANHQGRCGQVALPDTRYFHSLMQWFIKRDYQRQRDSLQDLIQHVRRTLPVVVTMDHACYPPVPTRVLSGEHFLDQPDDHVGHSQAKAVLRATPATTNAVFLYALFPGKEVVCAVALLDIV